MPRHHVALTVFLSLDEDQAADTLDAGHIARMAVTDALRRDGAELHVDTPLGPRSVRVHAVTSTSEALRSGALHVEPSPAAYRQ